MWRQAEASIHQGNLGLTLPFQGPPILQAHILCFFFFLQVLTKHFNIQRLCEAARPGVGISLCQQFHVSADSPTERPLLLLLLSYFSRVQLYSTP